MKRYFFLILLIIAEVLPQAKNPVLATIPGQKNITGKELNLRYSASIFHYKKKELDSIDKGLYGLTAERLLVPEALKAKIDTTFDFKSNMKNKEKELMLYVLNEKEIQPKLTINPDYLAEASELSRYDRRFYVYSREDSVSAVHAYDSLKNNVRPDSVSGHQLMSVKVGSFEDEEQELMLLRLEQGEFTKPIQKDGFWYIFFVKDKYINKKMDRYAKRDSIVKFWIEVRRGNNFKKALFPDFKVSELAYNENVIPVLVNTINAMVRSKGKGVNFLPALIDTLALYHNEWFADVYGKKITLIEFLNHMYYKPFVFDGPLPLKDYADQIMEFEYITADAYRRGLDKDPFVVEKLMAWKDYNLTKIFVKNIENPDEYISSLAKKAKAKIDKKAFGQYKFEKQRIGDVNILGGFVLIDPPIIPQYTWTSLVR